MQKSCYKGKVERLVVVPGANGGTEVKKEQFEIWVIVDPENPQSIGAIFDGGVIISTLVRDPDKQFNE